MNNGGKYYMFNLKNSMFILLACVCLLITLSGAFASEINTDSIGEGDFNDASLISPSQLDEVNLKGTESALNDFDNLNDESDAQDDNSSSSEIGNEAYFDISVFCSDFKGSAADNVCGDGECEIFIDPLTVNFKTFEEVCRDIETLTPGEIYNIESDYVIADSSEDLRRNRIINIKADNVVINGNGHIIDAKGSEYFFALFNVTGNNVTITNLGITNSHAINYPYSISDNNIYGDDYNKVISPVEWHGDKGVISNCTFHANSGEMGGAVYWMGNNGLIDNCVFDENDADVGGALYILGAGNSIVNSSFVNSFSLFNFEAIYLADKSTLSLTNCSFRSTYKHAKMVEVENDAQVIYADAFPAADFPAADFSELAYCLSNLKDNEVFNIMYDYEIKSYDKFPVINANNVTINGNGHKIFGPQPAYKVLYINGSGVEINDLSFDLAEGFLKGDTYITWNGDNGELKNCVFTGNSYNGETISWTGDNAVIDNCVFEDNPHKSGNSIYMEGTNIIISNCVYTTTNATSFIYYTNRHKGGSLVIANCSFDNENDIDEIWVGDDCDVVLNGWVIPKTFADLCGEISSLEENETYKIYKDYYFTQADGRYTINNRNIVIDGRGHVFDGNALSSFLNVAGDSIVIKNVNFNNFNNDNGESFITWSGDNGVFMDCSLDGNVALNGGAITWSGNGGLIDDCKFVDNLACGVGGAIYMSGFNNAVFNTLFSNSLSRWSGEAVYLDREGNNYTFSNVTFTKSDTYIIDGYYSDIDIDCFNDSVIASMCGTEFDLIPLAYVTIVKDKIYNVSEDIYCYSSYDEFGDGSVRYTFNIVKTFSSGVTYQKSYNFLNKTIPEVFDAIVSGDYYYTANIVKNLNIGYNDLRAYESASKYCVYQLAEDNRDAVESIIKDMGDDLASSDDLVIALNVSFASGSYFTSNAQWSNDGFNVVYINGHGSTVKSTSDEDDKYTFYENYAMLSIVDLTIEQFNHAIVNYGTCILSNVNFRNNHIVYTFASKDWGAAILNVGTCICYNCTFENNIARCGGAIFNQGVLTLEDCQFHGNDVESSIFNYFGITTGGIGIDICNVRDKGSLEIIKSSADIDYVNDLDATLSNGIKIICVVASFMTGALIGAGTGSVKAGIAGGMIVGGVIGAIGSAIICYNKMDATYDCLKTTLCLIGCSMAAGAVGGSIGGVLSTIVAARGVEQPQDPFILAYRNLGGNV